MISTVERARGRWRELLPLLGIAPRYLQNRHGPCPICGGKDRFKFDDKAGEGTYFCNQCGAGTGLILARKLHGWTYAKACSEVDRIIGTAERSPTISPTKQTGARAASAIQRALNDAHNREVVGAYLIRRGLTVETRRCRPFAVTSGS